MKPLKKLPVLIVALLSLQSAYVLADDLKVNKRLLSPQNTAQPINNSAPANSAPVANPGSAVLLNPQPLPPVDQRAQLPINTINLQSKLPAPQHNMDGKFKPGLAPLTPAANTGGFNSGLQTIDICAGNPCIISVNNKNVSNTTFKPGTRYQITGKKFGQARGDVILNIDGDVAVKLDVTAWRDEEIIAYFKNDFGGKPNSDNAALFIDIANTPRISALNSQRGKFEALIVKQTIPFSKIPQNAITYEKGAFGEPHISAAGYSFSAVTNNANKTIDSIKHPFTDKIKLNFINPNFKVLEVNAVFGRTDTNGSRCDRCGAGSGGVYVYGSYGWELKAGNELWVSRAVWHNHGSPISPPYVGHAPANADGFNQFESSVDQLEIVVEGPKGVNPAR